MPNRAKPAVAIAALTLGISKGSSDIQLTPAGEFSAVDGRPGNMPKVAAKKWRIDGNIAARVIARLSALKNARVIDYEHQTLLAEKNGQAAPASGWWEGANLEWREGVGLFATNVAWTAKAKQMIEADEYRYISPVFEFDRATGDILDIKHVALTNDPGIDGMEQVTVAACRAFSTPDQPDTEITMNETLKKLLAALGLQDTTTEEAALSAVAALKSQRDELQTKVAEKETAIAALKSASPDPAKFVSVETMTALQGEVAALRGKLNGQELEGLVGEALEAGKLLPAQEAWARELGGKDIASLKAYLDKAPVVAPGKPQSGGKGPEGGAGGNGQLSEYELAVCKQLGISAEEFAKSKVAA